MTIWEGILLGVIQGLTEFLPVSSSGHLVIVQSFMEEFQQPGVLFDVMLHFGTIMAVMFFLRKDLSDIVRSFLPRKYFENYDESLMLLNRKMAYYIVAGTVFTVIIGFTFRDNIHNLFESPRVVSLMLLITGLLLFFSDKIKNAVRVEKDMTLTDSIIIGIVQGIALIPGISRSGSTIAFGIFRKLNGKTAARFSFLLSVPAVLGATILEIRHIGSVPFDSLIIYIIGTIIAAFTGLMTLKLLFYIIEKRELKIFAYYCWFLGISTLIIKSIV